MIIIVTPKNRKGQSNQYRTTVRHLFGGYGYCYVYFIVDNGGPNYHSGHLKKTRIKFEVAAFFMFTLSSFFTGWWFYIIILKNDGVRQWEG